VKQIFNLILVLIFMSVLIVERSSCFEIMVVGLLLGIMLELEKNKNDK